MRRSEMAIVVDELLVIRLFSGHGHVQFVLICSAGHGQTPGVHATTTARERYKSASGNPKRSEKTASRSAQKRSLFTGQTVDTSVLQNYSGAVYGSQPAFLTPRSED